MNRIDEKITEVWNEVIVKEKLKTIITLMTEIKSDQIDTRKIIKEELTTLWTTSEIPIFKQILEKLTLIQLHLEKDTLETGTTSQTCVAPVDENEKKPELVHVNVWTRSKTPVLVDISEVKPKLTEGVGKIVSNLAHLHKTGKF